MMMMMLIISWFHDGSDIRGVVLLLRLQLLVLVTDDAGSLDL